jgi:hypothetical protein
VCGPRLPEGVGRGRDERETGHGDTETQSRNIHVPSVIS